MYIKAIRSYPTLLSCRSDIFWTHNITDDRLRYTESCPLKLIVLHHHFEVVGVPKNGMYRKGVALQYILYSDLRPRSKC